MLLSTCPNGNLSSPFHSFPCVLCHSMALISKSPRILNCSEAFLQFLAFIEALFSMKDITPTGFFFLMFPHTRVGVLLLASSPLCLFPTCHHWFAFETHTSWPSTLASPHAILYPLREAICINSHLLATMWKRSEPVFKVYSYVPSLMTSSHFSFLNWRVFWSSGTFFFPSYFCWPTIGFRSWLLNQGLLIALVQMTNEDCVPLRF